jgi:hypothetical protein
MNIKLSFTITLLLSSTLLTAMQFQTIGYKSIAMGGASVACSSGSVATYNNPALLAKSDYTVEVSLGGGASLYDHGAGASMQSLDDTDFLDTLDRVSQELSQGVFTISQTDINNLYAGKDVIVNMDGQGVETSPQAYLAAQVYGFGFGVFGTSDAVSIAHVDQEKTRLIFEDPYGYSELNRDGSITTGISEAQYTSSSMEYAINNGTTYAQVDAIGIVEVPLAYSHKFETSAGNIYVGGAIKYMLATTYTEQYTIDNADSVSSSEEIDSSDFGIDFGLAYEPSFVKDLTLALVAKDLNTPEFTFGVSTIEVEPMVRAGLAYDIFDSLEFAMDLDLTANKTLIATVENQMLGGGLNYHPASRFALRGGLMQNLDNDDKAGIIYTAGIGFGTKWLQLDLSGQISNNSQTVQDTTYPQYAKVNLALISRW